MLGKWCTTSGARQNDHGDDDDDDDDDDVDVDVDVDVDNDDDDSIEYPLRPKRMGTQYQRHHQPAHAVAADAHT